MKVLPRDTVLEAVATELLSVQHDIQNLLRFSVIAKEDNAEYEKTNKAGNVYIQCIAETDFDNKKADIIRRIKNLSNNF